VIRKTLVLAALVALSIPVAGLGAPRAGDGTLSVEDGRGKVIVHARGGLIGRLDRGIVTVYDLSPNDAHVPVVTGADRRPVPVGRNGVRYRGDAIRFRVVGGHFRVVVEGRGIDLSVVGRGTVFVQGETASPGLYSLDGEDCRLSPATCEPLPEAGVRYKLGGPEAGERVSRTKPE
jgi:hypothetical protein